MRGVDPDTAAEPPPPPPDAPPPEGSEELGGGEPRFLDLDLDPFAGAAEAFLFDLLPFSVFLFFLLRPIVMLSDSSEPASAEPDPDSLRLRELSERTSDAGGEREG